MYRQANSNLTRFGIFQAETEANVIVSVLYVYAPSRTRPDSFCGHACSQRVVEVNWIYERDDGDDGSKRRVYKAA